MLLRYRFANRRRRCSVKKLLLFILGSLVFGLVLQPEMRTQTPNRDTKVIEEAELRTAASKAIKLIQHAQSIWYQKETCTSCHHQLLPQIPFSLARERGVQLDEKAARETTANAFAFLKDLDSVVQGYDFIDVMFDGWELTTAARAGIRPSAATDA